MDLPWLDIQGNQSGAWIHQPSLRLFSWWFLSGATVGCMAQTRRTIYGNHTLFQKRDSIQLNPMTNQDKTLLKRFASLALLHFQVGTSPQQKVPLTRQWGSVLLPLSLLHHHQRLTRKLSANRPPVHRTQKPQRGPGELLLSLRGVLCALTAAQISMKEQWIDVKCVFLNVFHE